MNNPVTFENLSVDAQVLVHILRSDRILRDILDDSYEMIRVAKRNLDMEAVQHATDLCGAAKKTQEDFSSISYKFLSTYSDDAQLEAFRFEHLENVSKNSK